MLWTRIRSSMEGLNGQDGGNMSMDVLDKTSVELWFII